MSDVLSNSCILEPRAQTFALQFIVYSIVLFLPRDALQCKARSCYHLSSVRLSVCLSVTLVDHDHIGWKSWKLIVRKLVQHLRSS